MKNAIKIMRAEWLVMQEFYLYSLRHPRYFVIALYLYLPSLFYFRKLSLFRLGFCMLQYLDDLADGDRLSKLSPERILEDALDQLHTENFSSNRFGRLADAFFYQANKAQLPLSELKDKFIGLIRLLQLDYRRRVSLSRMPEQELLHHLNQTFSQSIDLAMIILKSNIRASQTPQLVKAFGICSLIRDLEDDLSIGIINLPLELIAHSEGGEFPFNQLKRSAIQTWLLQQFQDGKLAIDLCSVELNAVQKEQGIFVIRIFEKSMRRFFLKPEKFHFLSPLA
ncbi:MAG: hypothetical protein LCH37_12755 [Bacteroidetes bacterium]|nr:hypothetical protein [Bacteroidota bacterium]